MPGMYRVFHSNSSELRNKSTRFEDDDDVLDINRYNNTTRTVWTDERQLGLNQTKLVVEEIDVEIDLMSLQQNRVIVREATV